MGVRRFPVATPATEPLSDIARQWQNVALAALERRKQDSNHNHINRCDTGWDFWSLRAAKKKIQLMTGPELPVDAPMFSLYDVCEPMSGTGSAKKNAIASNSHHRKHKSAIEGFCWKQTLFQRAWRVHMCFAYSTKQPKAALCQTFRPRLLTERPRSQARKRVPIRELRQMLVATMHHALVFSFLLNEMHGTNACAPFQKDTIWRAKVTHRQLKSRRADKGSARLLLVDLDGTIADLDAALIARGLDAKVVRERTALDKEREAYRDRQERHRYTPLHDERRRRARQPKRQQDGRDNTKRQQ